MENRNLRDFILRSIGEDLGDGGDLYLVNDFGGNILGEGIEFNPSITF